MSDELDLNPADEERYLVSLLLPVTTRLLRDDALRAVDPADFCSGHYGGIWEAARRLQDEDRRIDLRSLLAECDGKDSVARILDRVSGSVPTAADFPHAVATVRRAGQLRRLVEAAERIKQRAMVAEDFAQACGWAQDELEKVASQQTEIADVRQIGGLLDEFMDSMRDGPRYSIIPTPWSEVNDQIAGGLHGGRMYIVGGRPGDGKSLAAVNLAAFAAKQGHPALVFSVEMGAMEVTGRVVANGAKIELSEIARYELSADSWSSASEYVARARDDPLFVNDKAGINVGYIKSVCRSQKRKTGLDVVVVDYLQLLSSDKSQPREQQVALISRSLKELSRELDAAVVVPAQLNRESAKRGKPMLADLRESGGIEADADVVMLLARLVHEDGDRKGEYTGTISIDIAKNRHGRTGAIELPWRGHYATIG